MNTELKYEDVPYGYAHCFHHQCILKDKCMHYLVGTLTTSLHPVISTINLLHVPEDTSKCDSFFLIQQMKIAWGLKHLYDNLPYNIAKKIKATIILKLGRTQYYRLYRQENGIDPTVRRFIKGVFEQHKIEEEPAYERYTVEYRWRNNSPQK